MQNIQINHEEYNGPGTEFGYVCTVTLTFEIWPLVKVMTPLGHGQQLCNVSRYNMTMKSYGLDTDCWYMSALCLRDMTLSQGHDKPLCSGQQFCKISRSNGITCKELCPGHGFWMCVHSDLDPGKTTLNCIKAMPHQWARDSNCLTMKYFPDRRNV